MKKHPCRHLFTNSHRCMKCGADDKPGITTRILVIAALAWIGGAVVTVAAERYGMYLWTLVGG